MNNSVIESVAVKGIEQEGDITIEKPVYTFRKLNSTDMFLMFKIMGKIGVNEFAKSFGQDSVKEMIASITTDNPKGNVTTMVGISVILEMANIILGNLHKCEGEIYQILSNTSNLSVKQIKELDFATFTEMVIEFIKKEEFKDFIKVVSKSFKLVK